MSPSNKCKANMTQHSVIPVLRGSKSRRSGRHNPPASSFSRTTACHGQANGYTSAATKALDPSGATEPSFIPRQRVSEQTCTTRNCSTSCARHFNVPSCKIQRSPSIVTPRVTAGVRNRDKAPPHAPVQVSKGYRPLKRKKPEPTAPPSAQLLGKLAAKFPRLSRPRTGDG